MLSLFPELLFLAPFSAFIIRVAIGALFGLSAYRRIFDTSAVIRALGILEGVLAVLLIAGAYTQAAAIVGAILIAFALLVPRLRTFPRSTLILLFILCISLLVTGPGPFAFDLPL